MAEIGRIISSTLNIEEAYERFAEEVSKLIPFDRIIVTLNNKGENTITLAYVTGMSVEDRRAGGIIPLSGSVSEEIVRTRSSLLIQPGNAEDMARQFPLLLPNLRAGIQSMVAAPLISKDEVIGICLLQSTKPNAYTEENLRLAERVGNQIAGAIANSQLFAERKRAQEEREKLIQELQKALAEVKTLGDLLPICASCKKIRDDKGYWNQIESYLLEHTDAKFSHSLCPDCMKKLYPDFT